MARTDRNAASRQVEMILRKLSTLSTLPQVAAGFLPHLVDGRGNMAVLSEIIEADPALTAQVLSQAAEQGVEFSGGKPNVPEAVAKLPPAAVRDAVLSVKVFQACDDQDDPDSRRILPRKQVVLYALAVACCARDIAELVLPEPDRPLAFSAGLLHGIGKLALDDVMPKSFEKIVAEAREQNAAFATVARKHLGLDHTLIGKRLAEKWGLPEEVILAIWLQGSDADAVSQEVPGARIAQIVRLACAVARQCGIGMSGDFDAPAPIYEMIESLSLSPQQIEHIHEGLPQEVARKSQLLGLDLQGGTLAYCGLISETAARLSQDNTDLAEKNNRFAAGSAQMSFLNEFLLGLAPDMSVIDVASSFVAGFQRTYQMGPVCLYMQSSPDEVFLDLVTVGETGRVDTALLHLPIDTPLVPEAIQSEFSILDVAESAPWLIEQVEVDIHSARIAPLLVSGKAVGAVLFTERVPADPKQLTTLLSVATTIAANIIGMKYAAQKQQRLAERFAELLGRLQETRAELTSVKALSGIAEMAAGAAHELNNPLAVISGRAQLLRESETDDNRRQMLDQIRQRTEDISGIISDLMAFARPKEPSRQVVSVRSLLDQTIDRVKQKHNLENPEIEIQGVDDLPDVYVDPEQIAAALVNIVSNALESYPSGSGPVRIDGSAPQSQAAVTIQIGDTGAGMDRETLEKAAQPFFSAKPAGRSRGMGLSRAQRMLQMNQARIILESEPDKGTTVTIHLPQP